MQGATSGLKRLYSHGPPFWMTLGKRSHVGGHTTIWSIAGGKTARPPQGTPKKGQTKYVRHSSVFLDKKKTGDFTSQLFSLRSVLSGVQQGASLAQEGNAKKRTVHHLLPPPPWTATSTSDPGWLAPSAAVGGGTDTLAAGQERLTGPKGPRETIQET